MVKITTGLRFRSQHFKGLVTVLTVNEDADELRVKIDPEEEGRHEWEEDWVLSHTRIGFERREYEVV